MSCAAALLSPPRLLLVSRDAALLARTRRALSWLDSVRGPAALVCAASLEGLGADVGAELLLLDVEAVAPCLPAPEPPSAPIPLLWLGHAPLLAEGVPAPAALPGPVVDFLDRQLPTSKLAFILQQHLAALPWRLRRRVRGRRPPPPQDLNVELNNTLTGLLGNAVLACEWAHAPGRRLPPPLARRLLCIAELAGRMRELVGTAESSRTAVP